MCDSGVDSACEIEEGLKAKLFVKLAKSRLQIWNDPMGIISSCFS